MHDRRERDWTQTVALVTGGGHGIGRATALAMARRGATVFICGRTADALEDTRDELMDESTPGAGEIIARVANVSNADDVAGLVEEIRSRSGRLDVLVNNAGVLGPRTPIEEVRLEDWEQVLAVNLTGTFLVSRDATALLRESTYPVIINMSSSVGRRGRGTWGPYAVSKHGVEGLTDTLADELRDDGVCVVSLNPGGTATRMRAEAVPDEDPSQLPSPDHIAKSVLMLAETLELGQSGQKFDSRALLGSE